MAARGLFWEYNSKFFDNNLDAYQVIDGDHADYMDDKILAHRLAVDGPFGIAGYTCTGQNIIFINPRLNERRNRRERRYTLFHEMAHAATSEGHTEKWLQEMERLQRLGALKINNLDRMSVLDEADAIEEWKAVVKKYQLTSPDKLQEAMESDAGYELPMLLEPACCDFCRDDFYRQVGVLAKEAA